MIRTKQPRCDALGVCLESGILTARHSAELVAWYLRSAVTAQEIPLRQVPFQQALNPAPPVTLTAAMGAPAPVYAAVALQAADHPRTDRNSTRLPASFCRAGQLATRHPFGTATAAVRRLPSSTCRT